MHTPVAETIVPWLVYAVPFFAVVTVYGMGRSRRSRANHQAMAASQEAGLDEPASLHPVINPNRCLGCGSCVAACPEGDVLGLIDGHAHLIQPSNCIGHGACAAACPFDAITLALGTERRGVDIPVLSPRFETNVPGIFVAGELGGMGMIRNAVEQGRQAIESVLELDGIGSGDQLDVLIVGAGPAGLTAALAAKRHGLRAVTLDQEVLGGSLTHYPRHKLVMTSPVELPLYGKLPFREVNKESLLEFWHDVVNRTGVPIRDHERVESIEKAQKGFMVRTSRGTWRARSVVLAIGRRGTPRKLGVPGEDSSKVVYRLLDPAQYVEQHVVVVGGGDSALEAAAALAEEGACRSVHLCHRSAGFSRAKPRNRERVESVRRAGLLHTLFESQLREIHPTHVRVASPRGEHEIENDAVVVYAGGILPNAFLESIGVEIETKRGTPFRLPGVH